MPFQNRRERWAGDWLTVALLLGGVLLLYYAVPILSLFLAQSPTAVLSELAAPSVVSAATTSILSASITTVIAVCFGVPLAYWLARTTVSWRPLVDAAVVLPLVLPPVVGGVVLLTVIGPNTVLGSVASSMGYDLTGSLIGIVLAQTFVASPFVIVTARAAFAGVDQDLEHASRSLGKSRLTTVRRVTLPMAWPGIVAGVTLTFARAMGEFGATIMLAYHPRTMPVEIWVTFLEAGLGNAYPVAVVLVCLSLLALVALNVLGSDPWSE